MLRRLRREAVRRDELIAREKAKFDAQKALEGPADAAGGLRSPERRRRRTTEAAAE
jgi:hypothetical protein